MYSVEYVRIHTDHATQNSILMWYGTCVAGMYVYDVAALMSSNWPRFIRCPFPIVMYAKIMDFPSRTTRGYQAKQEGHVKNKL